MVRNRPPESVRAATCQRPLFFPYSSDDALAERVAMDLGTNYIIAAGGAGSSGLPRFARGKRINRTPSSNKTMKPAR